ncbi:myrosinase 1-like [Agrilus planipennis]|uniref:Myrosinase 1-like n=1 Tax=Agrilus planipennis TaxID=224129 RepID=A0A1W4XAC4_AGRPL|nr:myrosinase 1-like [Agrilus planipennis]
MKVLLYIFGLLVFSFGTHGDSIYQFPDDFLFGTAAAAYQNEGAWNVSGKGPSIWDTFTHLHSEFVVDHSNGDVACDAYHKFKEDVQILKELGVKFYRFSIAWTRIFPTGLPHNPNADGIAFYNALLDELQKNSIIPMVTIFHWDVPQPLQNLGGFMNPKMIDYYIEYARVAFENFGDRVRYWITFNEPKQFCQEGHGEAYYAPALNMSGVADYLCGHNLLRSHAAAYHLYNDIYRPLFGGEIGITLNGLWFEPSNPQEEEAAERMRQFYLGWWAHPIFTAEGDYPPVMKEYIAKRSAQQGFRWSRLPEFTAEEVEYIKGSADFLGFNHYSTFLAANAENDDLTISFANDHQVKTFLDPSWPKGASSWLSVVPWGFRKFLKWLRDSYDNPYIVVTENGYSDLGQIHDAERVSYYGQYLEALLQAIYEDNVSVIAYAAWTLMDNFEWFDGYKSRFGLYYVDFSSPNRPRIAKDSARFYKYVIGNNTVVPYKKVN